VASFIGLAALASMMLDGLMKTMIRSRNALLAIVVGPQSWRASEEQKSRQSRSGQRYFARAKNSRLKFRLHPVLLFSNLRPKSRVEPKLAPRATSPHTKSSPMIPENSCIGKTSKIKSAWETLQRF